MTSLGRLGRRNSSSYMRASFDELRIYDRPLGLSEIRAIGDGPQDIVEDLKVAESPKVVEDPKVVEKTDGTPALETRILEFPKANLTALFGRVPNAGIHPRILFGPDALPAIRSRIKNTGSGKKA